MTVKTDPLTDPFYVYSDEVLEETPTRLTQFLVGLGVAPEARTLLATHGLDADAIIEGRALLLACLAQPEAPPGADTPSARSVRAAVAEVDQLDEPLYAKARATLARFHPSAARYVFSDVAPSTGVAAVQAMATFLARLDALESGSDPTRAASRAEDAAAVKKLAERGITKQERARLAALVATALGPTEVLADLPDLKAERKKNLLAARLWYEDWVATAKAHVKKRRHLIRLGLASPRKPKGGEPPAGEPPDDED